MNEFEKLQKGPNTHPILPLLRYYCIPTYKLAHYLGITPPYCSKILHGHFEGSKRIQNKLEKVYKHLKGKGDVR
jgi:hypothetical protein